MKKIYLVITLCIITVAFANAQGIGVKAGVNLANFAYSEDGEDENQKMNPGLQLGVVYEAELSDVFYFSPGILFSQKGTKYKYDESDMGITVEVTERTIINYLEIPLNFAYKADLGGAKLVIEAGPYVAFAINGKYKAKLEFEGEEEEEEADIEFGSDDDQMKSLDMGINAGVGFEFSSLKVGVQYGLGLGNLVNDDDFKMHNRVVGVSVGYFFGR